MLVVSLRVVISDSTESCQIITSIAAPLRIRGDTRAATSWRCHADTQRIG
ncbi:hypothetical protein X777_01582 [Ooceraea biroi]|uniref:Uncharacterized protein n=1 Tax=Ooceraea biroi TaxID=2015173 RepID=A0A026WQK2_OOCBI|nr:hypothetical protein X777_01582 [Ooceraea biroi]